jgi:hypothetical protein
MRTLFVLCMVSTVKIEHEMIRVYKDDTESFL